MTINEKAAPESLQLKYGVFIFQKILGTRFSALGTPEGLQSFRAVLSVLSIFRLEDDAWRQHLHRMPCTGRHHTAEVAKARVEHIASRLLEPPPRRHVLCVHSHREVLGTVLLLVYDFHQLTREADHRLITMRVAV